MDMRGFLWVGESLLNHDKWQINIIEWIFMQFTFNILWVTLIQKIITRRVSANSQMDMREICMGEGKFIKPWQVTDKIIEWHFYAIHIQHFMSDSNSKNNNMYGSENSRMNMKGCVWVGESFLSHDKWKI